MSEDPICITFKLDGNAPWIVVRAVDAADTQRLIAEIEPLAPLIAATHNSLVAAGKAAPVGQMAQAVQTVQQVVGGQVIPMQPQYQQQQQAPQQQGYRQNGAPPGPVPKCNHDLPRKWVAAKDGSWKGWFCGVPQGGDYGPSGKCKTLYDRS